MRFREYGRVLRRRAWIPALLVGAAVVTAGGLALLTGQTYTATASVFAAVPAGNTRTVNYSQTSTSVTLASGIIQSLSLNESPEELAQQIHVHPVGSDLYRVSVTRSNRDAALAIADEVASQSVALYKQYASQLAIAPGDPSLAKLSQRLHDAYAAALTARLKFQQAHPGAASAANTQTKDVAATAQLLQLQLEEDVAGQAYRNVLAEANKQQLDQFSQASDFNAFVLDRAVAKPDAGAPVQNVLIAAALALVLGLGLVFLLDHLDSRSVQNPESAEEIIGAPVIGIIPRTTPRGLRSVKGSGG